MKSEKVPFMLSIPKKYRDQLRRLAAEQNYKNPDRQTFAATIATQVLCEYLEQLSAEK